jgi:hypothetical protein
MNKPSSFSLSSLSGSLAKIPKTYLYAGAGAVLLGALGVVAINMLATPAVEDIATPAPITAPANPDTVATGSTPTDPGTSTPNTSAGASASTGNASNPSGSDDIGGGPSRSLDVQPIPFLVTEANKPDPNNPNGTRATTQAINTRPASSAIMNPFAPLTVESTGNVNVAQTAPNPNFGGNTAPQARPTRQSSTIAAVNPGRVVVRQTGRLPSFTPTQAQPNRPFTGPATSPNTRPPSAQTGQAPRPTPGQAISGGRTVTVKPGANNNPTGTVQKIPAAVANAKPAVRAPTPGVSGPSSSANLSSTAPTTPGLMRQVVPENKPATDPGSTVIPIGTPTATSDPELTGDFVALTEPNILGGPIELREPGTANVATPSPLDASIPRAAIADPATPPEVTVVPTVIDSLTGFVNTRGLNFVGVVLGPVNTAIFETKDGTVVVPLGANLPQSDVIVKTITADQVVLMQGQNTIILSRAK